MVETFGGHQIALYPPRLGKTQEDRFIVQTLYCDTFQQISLVRVGGKCQAPPAATHVTSAGRGAPNFNVEHNIKKISQIDPHQLVFHFIYASNRSVPREATADRIPIQDKTLNTTRRRMDRREGGGDRKA